MDFLFPKTLHIFNLSIIGWLGMHEICPFNKSHAQKSHLGAKDIPYHTAILAREGSSLTHSLFNGPHFRVLWGPYGSNPKFDPLITTGYI